MPWYVAWAPTPSNGQLGGVYIGPNTKLAVGEKLQFSAAHRTVRWCTGQRTVACPVRLVVALSEQVTVGTAGFPHRIVRCSHRTVRWSSLRVPPRTSRWAEVPWCTGANSIGGKNFIDIWENGGRGMAHEIIKKNEKDIHDTRESIKTAENAAKLEKRIGMTIIFNFVVYFCDFELTYVFYRS
jgi:hypothetical protein